MPPTVHACPSSSKETAHSLGCVSVVMMAHAASWAASALAAAARARAGTPSVKGSSASGTPITPVEATKTSSGAAPRTWATMSALPRATSMPGCPVAAFALPEFKTTARARPFAATSRETATGAAAKLFFVKTPAAVAALPSATTSAASRRPGFLRNPRCNPAAEKPRAAQTPPST